MHLRVCMRVRGRVHVREGVSDAREGGAREGTARESVQEHVRVAAWRGAARRGVAWRGAAWRGAAWRGIGEERHLRRQRRACRGRACRGVPSPATTRTWHCAAGSFKSASVPEQRRSEGERQARGSALGRQEALDRTSLTRVRILVRRRAVRCGAGGCLLIRVETLAETR